jgi:wyosine [tRNA(Phe)-imidazoG37] synthetase (radical SAM superfamily)
MNPDKFCNFDCVYCEVDRSKRVRARQINVRAMATELERTLQFVNSGSIGDHPHYQGVPAELLRLRQVCLSGDGEPTLCPNFASAVEAAIHLRARGQVPWFKLVLVTNASGLDQPEVERGLSLFSSRDEVWAKLEAGTQDYLQRVSKADCRLEDILAKILHLARQRAVIIQSLFPAINGQAPPPPEIEAYVQRLKELKDAGAQIPLVQIYSATRPTPHSECGHLPLRTLSGIAKRVREVTALKTEVF